MKYFLPLLFSMYALSSKAALFLHNEYGYLQDITFEMYSDDIPEYKMPEVSKSAEEVLMFEVMHANWTDKRWVAYTMNEKLLGTYKIGQPALMDNGDNKKIFFIASFPGTAGGTDLYMAEYKNGAWNKPKNLGKNVNTEKNEANPGLLNEHTLTYSSGGIIKKLDLRTFEVVELSASTPAAEKKPEPVVNSTVNTPVTAVNNAIVVKESIPVIVEKPAPVVAPAPVVVKETPAPSKVTTPVSAPVVSATNNNTGVVNMLGTATRDQMLAKYHTAIQLGAFSAPKWESFAPLAAYGKLVSYKNEKNMYVVWLTGYAGRTAAEAVLPQVKAVPGFENAYVTGK